METSLSCSGNQDGSVVQSRLGDRISCPMDSYAALAWHVRHHGVLVGELASHRFGLARPGRGFAFDQAEIRLPCQAIMILMITIFYGS